MSRDVVNRMKEDGYGPCDCMTDQCLAKFDNGWQVGRLGKPDRDGKRHIRGCPCPSCRGRRNNRKGNDKARKARKALNISGANTRHEELWGGELRSEMKAGGIIAPAFTAFRKCEQQSEAARPIGDNRVFAAVFMPDGESDGIVCCRLSQVYEFALAILENAANA